MSGSDGGLPAGWSRATLGAVCKKITDGTHHSPSKEAQTADGNYMYITAKNIKQWGIDVSDVTYLAEETHRPIYQRCDPEYGDVLYIKDGVTTGIATVNKLNEEFSLLSSVALLKPHHGVLEPRFLKWYLNGPGYDYMKSMMGGTAIKRLTLTKIKSAEIALAPLPEQRRIVAKIEELFSELDAGIAALEKAQARLERYRASVLQAAVEGRLTEQWREENPPEETGDELLERILVERREQWEQEYRAKYEAKGKNPPKGWKERYKEPEGPDASELPELPEGWCWGTVDQLTSLVTSGSRGWAKYYSDAGAIFVRAQDISTDSLLLGDVAYVDLPGSVEGTRSRLERDDILVTITGANVTKTAWVDRELGEAYINQHVAVVRPVEGRTAPYLYAWFVAPDGGRRRLEHDAYGAGKPGLNLTNIRDLPVALPPLHEAEVVASRCASTLEAIDRICESVKMQKKLGARLRQAILRCAFDGRLVPQNPDDEPASLLLERIQAERNGKGSKKKAPV